ncbi:MAG TPA: hypothetical protein EYH31_11500 [Anaerolineae bacterium]|nr:hypothetical protein [Anaerolineae bacterium]
MAETARRLTFHTPRDASPERVLALLRALSEAGITDEPSARSTRELVELAEAYAPMGGRGEPVVLMRVLGLLAGERRSYLTSEGQVMARLADRDPHRAIELIHGLYATTWNTSLPARHTVSFSYAQACRLFWEKAPFPFNSENRQVLAGEMIGAIRARFAGLDGYDVGTLSYRSFSLSGVTVWLEALSPPAVQDDVVQRRGSCWPELLVLALAQTYRESGAALGMDLLLTPERRTSICQICFLEPTALDRLLSWTLPIYPEIVMAGTGAGSYGRFIRLLRWPRVADLAT